jgi:hypothetical protein
MSQPDLETLVNGVTRLGKSYSPSDPVFQDMVNTSIQMIKALPDSMDNELHLLTLQSMQIPADLTNPLVRV